MKEKAVDELKGRTIFIPRMPYESAEVFASVYHSFGYEARANPEGDEITLELGSRYTSGDECLPQRVTLGNFLKVLQVDGYRPDEVAFFMPTVDGPCRFGQYVPMMRSVFNKLGYSDIPLISLTGQDAYRMNGAVNDDFYRTGMRALMAADILNKMVLMIRPYEVKPGTTDKAHHESVMDLCRVIEEGGKSRGEKLSRIIECLIRSRDRFRSVRVKFDSPRPLIGIVGEIFCRLNTFSNEDFIRRLEALGGEAWLSDITEWLFYTFDDEQNTLRWGGKKFSKRMFESKCKYYIVKRDEKALLEPFKEDFRGYEESSVKALFSLGGGYFPARGVSGEMVINTGKAVYLWMKGADGIIDISPFSCMNGIACEGIYPALSRDCDSIPIRNFYFDGNEKELDQDIEIFLEMAGNYMRKKHRKRIHPPRFTL